MPVVKSVPALPRKIWFGNNEFKCRLVPSADKALAGNDGMCYTGDPMEMGFSIYVNNELSLSKQLEIVWHEVTHAMNWVLDIADDEPEKPIEEEDIAEKHGLGWSQFLLDNPRFERWLVYTLKCIRKERRLKDIEEAKAEP